MTKKLLAFDIEIAKEIPEGETDWKEYRPFGITCAAAADEDGNLWNWWSHDAYGRFTPQMAKDEVMRMAVCLIDLSVNHTIITWNGLGFDFDILAEESANPNLTPACKQLALDHIDLMFQFFCTKGYPLGLDVACKGMGLPGKMDGIVGAKAPQLWAEGEYHKVLGYVSQDVKATVALAEAIREKGAIYWISRAGHLNQCEFAELMTVKEAMTLPQPDTSWMTDPWPRSKFYEWTEGVLPEKSQQFDHTGLTQWDPDGGNWPK